MASAARPPAPRTPALRTPAQQSGDAAERSARALLERAGLTWLASNVRCKVGEIDLVMRDADALVFVEVRIRRSARFGGAAASIDFRKRLRLQRAAQFYLQRHYGARGWPACRFDVVAIDGGRPEWIRAAFDAG
ncbi:MAG: YraN family protein [Lautropia sp.]